MEQWRKNLYALWLMRFLILVGTSLVFPFLPLYVNELGVVGEKAIARWSGAIYSVGFLSNAVFNPFWGTLGDKYGRKLMVIRGVLSLAVVVGLMGLVHHVYQLVILRFLQGCLAGIIPPALAIITAYTPKDRVGYALGLMETAMIGGSTIGPLLGGLMTDLIGLRPVFFVTAGMLLLASLVVAIYVKEEAFTARVSKRPMLFLNVRFVMMKKPILSMALSLMLINFAMMVIQPVFPLFVESMEIPRLGLATTIGGLFALTGIAAMLAAPFWGKRNDVKGPKPTLITSLAGTAILSSAQAFARNAYGLGAVRLFLGLFTGGTSPATQAIIVQNCPPSRRGGVFGITTSAGLLGAFFGPIVGGFLAASIGIRPLFVLTGAILLGICPLVSVLVKKGKPDIQTRLKTN